MSLKSDLLRYRDHRYQSGEGADHRDRLLRSACATGGFVSLIKPDIPIPKEAHTAVHGITDAMCQDQPTFKEVSQELISFFEGISSSDHPQ